MRPGFVTFPQASNYSVRLSPASLDQLAAGVLYTVYEYRPDRLSALLEGVGLRRPAHADALRELGSRFPNVRYLELQTKRLIECLKVPDRSSDSELRAERHRSYPEWRHFYRTFGNYDLLSGAEKLIDAMKRSYEAILKTRGARDRERFDAEARDRHPRAMPSNVRALFDELIERKFVDLAYAFREQSDRTRTARALKRVARSF